MQLILGKYIKFNYTAVCNQIVFINRPHACFFSPCFCSHGSFVVYSYKCVRRDYVRVTSCVLSEFRASRGRCSHICKCKVAPHQPSCKHASTPTQTAIHCARAACHVHLLTLVRSIQLHNPQETRRYTIVSPSTIRNVSKAIIIGEYECSESVKSQLCAEEFSHGVFLHRYDARSFCMC